MAMVQVDLSEYDMLREAKDKAEKRVKELEEDIKGLKDKSRVIIHTKYKVKSNPINISAAARTIVNMSRYLPYLSIEDVEKVLISSKKIIYTDIDTDSTNESEQLIGFDDVRVMVENKYKKELEDAINYYRESEESYHKLKDSAYDEVRKDYEDSIKKNESINAKLKEEKKEIIKTKDAKIKELQDKIAELSKSKEEKVAELTAIIEDAQKRLEEIYGLKKKGLFKSIVEKWKK